MDARANASQGVTELAFFLFSSVVNPVDITA
jgi:hypothetical protein